MNYAVSFQTYKSMLIENRKTASYVRIYGEYDTILFGKARVLRNDYVVDHGEYTGVVSQYNRELREEEAADARAAEFSPPPSSPPPSPTTLSPPSVHTGGSGLALSLAPLPHHSDRNVSISVTSHVSHTVAASSQVLNIVNGATPPSEDEVIEAPPPAKKAGRSRTKKKGGKSTDPSATTSNDIDADNAPPTKNKRSTRQTNAATEERPGRVTRSKS